jgi:hypothetical protein
MTRRDRGGRGGGCVAVKSEQILGQGASRSDGLRSESSEQRGKCARLNASRPPVVVSVMQARTRVAFHHGHWSGRVRGTGGTACSRQHGMACRADMQPSGPLERGAEYIPSASHPGYRMRQISIVASFSFARVAALHHACSEEDAGHLAAVCGKEPRPATERASVRFDFRRLHGTGAAAFPRPSRRVGQAQINARSGPICPGGGCPK